jgi:hypothetical protein
MITIPKERMSAIGGTIYVESGKWTGKSASEAREGRTKQGAWMERARGEANLQKMTFQISKGRFFAGGSEAKE